MKSKLIYTNSLYSLGWNSQKQRSHRLKLTSQENELLAAHSYMTSLQRNGRTYLEINPYCVINLTLIQRHIAEYTGFTYKTDLLLFANIFKDRHGYFYLFQLRKKHGAGKVRKLEI